MLKCGTGLHTVSAKTLSLDPGKSGEVSFRVQSYRAKGSDYVCESK